MPAHIVARENVQSPDGSVDVWRCAYALASQSPTSQASQKQQRRRDAAQLASDPTETISGSCFPLWEDKLPTILDCWVSKTNGLAL